MKSTIRSEEKFLPFVAVPREQTRCKLVPKVLVIFVTVLCILAMRIWTEPWSSFLLNVPNTSVSSRQHALSIEPTSTANLAGNGRTTDVLWDNYSLVIRGQRVFIQ